MSDKTRPTIEEIEAILEEDAGLIEIQPDGSIDVRQAKHAKPKIRTLGEVLGDSY